MPFSLSNRRLAQIKKVGPLSNVPVSVYRELHKFFGAEPGGGGAEPLSEEAVLQFQKLSNFNEINEQAQSGHWHTVWELVTNSAAGNSIAAAFEKRAPITSEEEAKAKALELARSGRWHNYLSRGQRPTQKSRKFIPGEEVIPRLFSTSAVPGMKYFFVGTYSARYTEGCVVVDETGAVKKLPSIKSKASSEILDEIKDPQKTSEQLHAYAKGIPSTVRPEAFEAIAFHPNVTLPTLYYIKQNTGSKYTKERILRQMLKLTGQKVANGTADDQEKALFNKYLLTAKPDMLLESTAIPNEFKLNLFHQIANGGSEKAYYNYYKSFVAEVQDPEFLVKLGEIPSSAIQEGFAVNPKTPLSTVDRLIKTSPYFEAVLAAATRSEVPRVLRQVALERLKVFQKSVRYVETRWMLEYSIKDLEGEIWSKEAADAITIQLTPPVLKKFLSYAKQSDDVTYGLLKNPQLPSNQVQKLMASAGFNPTGWRALNKINYQNGLATHSKNIEVLTLLSTAKDISTRLCVVQNLATSIELLTTLSHDTIPEVASEAQLRLRVPEKLTKQEMIQKGFAGKKAFDHETLAVDKKVPGYTLSITGTPWVRYIDAADTANEFPVDLFSKFRLHKGKTITKNGKFLGWVGGMWNEENKTLYVTEMQSDLLQRTFELREPRLAEFSKYKSLLENRFDGWEYVFFNQAVREAKTRGAKEIRVPTAKTYAKFVPSTYKLNKEGKNTGISSIYDKVAAQYANVVPPYQGGWYVIPVTSNIRVAQLDRFSVLASSNVYKQWLKCVTAAAFKIAVEEEGMPLSFISKMEFQKQEVAPFKLIKPDSVVRERSLSFGHDSDSVRRRLGDPNLPVAFGLNNGLVLVDYLPRRNHIEVISELLQTSEGQNLLDQVSTEGVYCEGTFYVNRVSEGYKEAIRKAKAGPKKVEASVTFHPEGYLKVATPRTVLSIAFDFADFVHFSLGNKKLKYEIEPDGGDYDKYEGVINFYVKQSYTQYLFKIVEQYTHDYNKRNEGRYTLSPFTVNESAMYKCPTIRIRVTDNKTAKYVQPPELQLANDNAYRLLKYLQSRGVPCDPEELVGSIPLAALQYALSDPNPPNPELLQNEHHKSTLDVADELGEGAQVIDASDFKNSFPRYIQKLEEIVSYITKNDLPVKRIVYAHKHPVAAELVPLSNTHSGKVVAQHCIEDSRKVTAQLQFGPVQLTRETYKEFKRFTSAELTGLDVPAGHGLSDEALAELHVLPNDNEIVSAASIGRWHTVWEAINATPEGQRFSSALLAGMSQASEHQHYLLDLSRAGPESSQRIVERWQNASNSDVYLWLSHLDKEPSPGSLEVLLDNPNLLDYTLALAYRLIGTVTKSKGYEACKSKIKEHTNAREKVSKEVAIAENFFNQEQEDIHPLLRLDLNSQVNYARNSHHPDVLAVLATSSVSEIQASVALNRRTPSGTLEFLAGSKNVYVKCCCAVNPGLSARMLDKLSLDKEMGVRMSVMNSENITAEIEERFACDPVAEVRAQAAKSMLLDMDMIRKLAKDKFQSVVAGVARNPRLHLVKCAELEVAAHPSRQVKEALVGNGNTSHDALVVAVKAWPMEDSIEVQPFVTLVLKHSQCFTDCVTYLVTLEQYKKLWRSMYAPVNELVGCAGVKFSHVKAVLEVQATFSGMERIVKAVKAGKPEWIDGNSGDRRVDLLGTLTADEYARAVAENAPRAQAEGVTYGFVGVRQVLESMRASQALQGPSYPATQWDTLINLCKPERQVHVELSKKEMQEKGFKGKESFDHVAVGKDKKVPGYTLGAPGIHWVRYIYAQDKANEFPPELFSTFNLPHSGNRIPSIAPSTQQRYIVQRTDKPLGWVGGTWDDSTKTLYVTELQSDLLQRTSELRDPRLKQYSHYKSLVENRFDGWEYVFFNQALREAKERGAKKVLVPTSATYTNRVPGAKNISKLYDKVVQGYPHKVLPSTDPVLSEMYEHTWYIIPVTDSIRIAAVDDMVFSTSSSIGPEPTFLHQYPITSNSVAFIGSPRVALSRMHSSSKAANNQLYISYGDTTPKKTTAANHLVVQSNPYISKLLLDVINGLKGPNTSVSIAPDQVEVYAPEDIIEKMQAGCIKVMNSFIHSRDPSASANVEYSSETGLPTSGSSSAASPALDAKGLLALQAVKDAIGVLTSRFGGMGVRAATDQVLRALSGVSGVGEMSAGEVLALALGGKRMPPPASAPAALETSVGAYSDLSGSEKGLGETLLVRPLAKTPLAQSPTVPLLPKRPIRRKTVVLTLPTKVDPQQSPVWKKVEPVGTHTPLSNKPTSGKDRLLSILTSTPQRRLPYTHMSVEAAEQLLNRAEKGDKGLYNRPLREQLDVIWKLGHSRKGIKDTAPRADGNLWISPSGKLYSTDWHLPWAETFLKNSRDTKYTSAYAQLEAQGWITTSAGDGVIYVRDKLPNYKQKQALRDYCIEHDYNTIQTDPGKRTIWKQEGHSRKGISMDPDPTPEGYVTMEGMLENPLVRSALYLLYYLHHVEGVEGITPSEFVKACEADGVSETRERAQQLFTFLTYAGYVTQSGWTYTFTEKLHTFGSEKKEGQRYTPEQIAEQREYWEMGFGKIPMTFQRMDEIKAKYGGKVPNPDFKKKVTVKITPTGKAFYHGSLSGDLLVSYLVSEKGLTEQQALTIVMAKGAVESSIKQRKDDDEDFRKEISKANRDGELGDFWKEYAEEVADDLYDTRKREAGSGGSLWISPEGKIYECSWHRKWAEDYLFTWNIPMAGYGTGPNEQLMKMGWLMAVPDPNTSGVGNGIIWIRGNAIRNAQLRVLIDYAIENNFSEVRDDPSGQSKWKREGVSLSNKKTAQSQPLHLFLTPGAEVVNAGSHAPFAINKCKELGIEWRRGKNPIVELQKRGWVRLVFEYFPERKLYVDLDYGKITLSSSQRRSLIIWAEVHDCKEIVDDSRLSRSIWRAEAQTHYNTPFWCIRITSEGTLKAECSDGRTAGEPFTSSGVERLLELIGKQPFKILDSKKEEAALGTSEGVPQNGHFSVEKAREILTTVYYTIFNKASKFFKEHDFCHHGEEGCAGDPEDAQNSQHCCSNCKHWSPTGCTTKSLSCKLWMCPKLLRKNPEAAKALWQLAEAAYRWNLQQMRGTPEEAIGSALDYFTRNPERWPDLRPERNPFVSSPPQQSLGSMKLSNKRVAGYVGTVRDEVVYAIEVSDDELVEESNFHYKLKESRQLQGGDGWRYVSSSETLVISEDVTNDIQHTIESWLLKRGKKVKRVIGENDWFFSHGGRRSNKRIAQQWFGPVQLDHVAYEQWASFLNVQMAGGAAPPGTPQLGSEALAALGEMDNYNDLAEQVALGRWHTVYERLLANPKGKAFIDSLWHAMQTATHLRSRFPWEKGSETEYHFNRPGEREEFKPHWDTYDKEQVNLGLMLASCSTYALYNYAMTQKLGLPAMWEMMSNPNMNDAILAVLYKKYDNQKLRDKIQEHPKAGVQVSALGGKLQQERQQNPLAGMNRQEKYKIAGASTDPWTLTFCAKDTEATVRAQAADNEALPVELMPALAEDTDQSVRSALARNKNLTSEVVEKLSYDTYTYTRSKIACHPKVTFEQLVRLAADPEPDVRSDAAENGKLNTRSENPAEAQQSLAILTKLSKDKKTVVRQGVCENPTIPEELALKLAGDRAHDVRSYILDNLSIGPNVLKVVISKLGFEAVGDLNLVFKHPSCTEDVITAALAAAEIGNNFGNWIGDSRPVRQALVSAPAFTQEQANKIALARGQYGNVYKLETFLEELQTERPAYLAGCIATVRALPIERQYTYDRMAEMLGKFIPEPDTSVILSKEGMKQKGFAGKEAFDHIAQPRKKRVPGYVLDAEGDPWIRYIYAYDVANEFPDALFKAFNLHHIPLGNGKPLGWVGGVWDDKNKTLYVTEMQSDLLQRTKELNDPRLAAYKQFRSRLENRFDGWEYVFFNQAIREAKDKGATVVKVPTSQFYTQQHPATKNIATLYDKVVQGYPHTTGDALAVIEERNKWHVIPVTENIRVAASNELNSYTLGCVTPEGEVKVKQIKNLEVAMKINHSDYGMNGTRFRSAGNTVWWWREPTQDEVFAVESALMRLGIRVTQHRAWHENAWNMFKQASREYVCIIGPGAGLLLSNRKAAWAGPLTRHMTALSNKRKAQFYVGPLNLDAEAYKELEALVSADKTGEEPPALSNNTLSKLDKLPNLNEILRFAELSRWHNVLEQIRASEPGKAMLDALEHHNRSKEFFTGIKVTTRARELKEMSDYSIYSLLASGALVHNMDLQAVTQNPNLQPATLKLLGENLLANPSAGTQSLQRLMKHPNTPPDLKQYLKEEHLPATTGDLGIMTRRTLLERAEDPETDPKILQNMVVYLRRKYDRILLSNLVNNEALPTPLLEHALSILIRQRLNPKEKAANIGVLNDIFKRKDVTPKMLQMAIKELPFHVLEGVIESPLSTTEDLTFIYQKYSSSKETAEDTDNHQYWTDCVLENLFANLKTDPKIKIDLAINVTKVIHKKKDLDALPEHIKSRIYKNIVSTDDLEDGVIARELVDDIARDPTTPSPYIDKMLAKDLSIEDELVERNDLTDVQYRLIFKRVNGPSYGGRRSATVSELLHNSGVKGTLLDELTEAAGPFYYADAAQNANITPYLQHKFVEFLRNRKSPQATKSFGSLFVSNPHIQEQYKLAVLKQYPDLLKDALEVVTKQQTQIIDLALKSADPAVLPGLAAKNLLPPEKQAEFEQKYVVTKQKMLEKGFKSKEAFDHVTQITQKHVPGYDLDCFGTHWCRYIDAYDKGNEFPQELFKSFNWHNIPTLTGKSLGWVGGMYNPNNKTLYMTELQSDLLQNTFEIKKQHPEFTDYKSRLENRYDGWEYVFFNQAIREAKLAGAQWVAVPTSKTYTKKVPGTKNISKLYDRIVAKYPHTLRGGWYFIELKEGIRIAMKMNAISNGEDLPLAAVPVGKLPAKAREELRGYFTAGDRIEIYPDPNIEGAFAARIWTKKTKFKEHFDLVWQSFGAEDKFAAWDEVEFTSWPPGSDAENLGRNLWAQARPTLTIPLSKLVKEHSQLVERLKKDDPEQIEQEKKKQSKELADYKEKLDARKLVKLPLSNKRTASNETYGSEPGNNYNEYFQKEVKPFIEKVRGLIGPGRTVATMGIVTMYFTEGRQFWEQVAKKMHGAFYHKDTSSSRYVFDSNSSVGDVVLPKMPFNPAAGDPPANFIQFSYLPKGPVVSDDEVDALMNSIRDTLEKGLKGPPGEGKSDSAHEYWRKELEKDGEELTRPGEGRSLEQLVPQKETISADWIIDEYQKAIKLPPAKKLKRIKELEGLSKHIAKKDSKKEASFILAGDTECGHCGGTLDYAGIDVNPNHIHNPGQLLECKCGKSKMWCNSVRFSPKDEEDLERKGVCYDRFCPRCWGYIQPLKNGYMYKGQSVDRLGCEKCKDNQKIILFTYHDRSDAQKSLADWWKQNPEQWKKREED